MSKSRIKARKLNVNQVRESIRHQLLNKYFNLWMNTLKFPDTLTYQQIDFIMRKFWGEGNLAGFIHKLTGEPVFTTFAASTYNTYDWPIKVQLLNPRGVPFIPSTLQEVDVDCVIGYAQKNKKSIAEVVMYYVDRIVSVEMVININLQVHKMPWLVVADPLTKQRIEEFMNQIDNDEVKIFLNSDEVDNFKALTSGATYIIDKLYAYKCSLENELDEYLGINNMGLAEKKEHLITAEVNSNNDMIERSGECIYDTIKDFFIRFKDFSGIDCIPDINAPKYDYVDDGIEDEDSNKESEEDVI